MTPFSVCVRTSGHLAASVLVSGGNHVQVSELMRAILVDALAIFYIFIFALLALPTFYIPFVSYPYSQTWSDVVGKLNLQNSCKATYSDVWNPRAPTER